MKRLALILCIGALVAPSGALAVPAQAGSWTKSCQTGQTTKVLTGSTFACYTPATGATTSDASPILDVSQCDNVDIFMSADWAGSGAACTVTWQIDNCSAGANNLPTNGAKNNACKVAAGVTNLSGTDIKSNLALQFLRVEGDQGAGVNITSCQIIAKCAMSGLPR